MAKISVIVPVYKVERYLDRCIQSILSQTYADIDVVLVDDGSPDKCPEICDRYAQIDFRVHVIHQENAGLSAARNAGIDWVFAHSNSEWITFVDSDDWIHSDMLRCLYTAAIENHVSVAKCQLALVRNEHDLPTEPIKPPRVYAMEDEYIKIGTSTVNAPTRLIRKEAFDGIRFPVGKLNEDLFIMHRLMFQYKQIVLVDSPLYYYWFNDSGITKSEWHPKRLDEFEAMEEQVRFFKKRKIKKVYIRMLCYYIKVIEWQYDLLVASKDLAKKERKKYQSLMKRRMRKILLFHPFLWRHQWERGRKQFEIAFPHLMGVYWRLIQLKKYQ